MEEWFLVTLLCPCATTTSLEQSFSTAAATGTFRSIRSLIVLSLLLITSSSKYQCSGAQDGEATGQFIIFIYSPSRRGECVAATSLHAGLEADIQPPHVGLRRAAARAGPRRRPLLARAPRRRPRRRRGKRAGSVSRVWAWLLRPCG
jgi:hypothetical protein